MKMRNRKMISAVVAAFMVVIMAGSAFAFGTGNLEFTGTASVDVELSVIIDEVAPGLSENPAYVVIAENRKSVTFNLAEVRIPDYDGSRYEFALFNEGNLPANVFLHSSIFAGSENWDEFIRITSELEGPGGDVVTYRVIAPNTSAGFRVIIDYDFDTEETIVNEHVIFTITLVYEWAR